MIVETLRMIAAALEHETYGVNEQLAQVPRDVDDAAPEAIARFLNPTSDDAAAREDEGDDWPALVVLHEQPADLEGEVGTIFRDGTVPVTIAYVHRDSDSAAAYTAAQYTLRAVQRTLAAFLSPANDADRLRNGVEILAATRLRLVPWTVPLGAIDHDGGLTVWLHVRDADPLELS